MGMATGNIEKLATAETAPPKGPPRGAAHTAGGPPQTAPAHRSAVTFETAPPTAGHRIVLYGPGGVGKTTLADLAPGPVVSFDLDGSLGVLRPAHTQRVAGVSDWQQLRDALNSPGWDEVGTIVIDSATKAEELAVAYTLKTVPTEKGGRATSIESYGYGKGYQFAYEVWMTLLADLDAHVACGRNVILACHDTTINMPNPAGDDYLYYCPRLSST